MARIRMVKPEMFDDPDLGAMSPLARWLFAGLLTQADKRGRLLDEPRRLKVRLVPFDDCDADGLLAELERGRFITRYQVDGVRVIQIRSFEKHQRPHPKEPESSLPAVERNGEPGKNILRKPDSGSLDSGSLDSESVCTEHGAKTAPVSRHTHNPGLVTNSLTHHYAHKGHAWCGERLCVPGFLHMEFARAAGGDIDDAMAALLEWYPTAHSTLAPGPVGKVLEWWREQFKAFAAAQHDAEDAAKLKRWMAGGTI